MGDHTIVHRHIHVLAQPGAAAGFQGQHYAQGRPHAGDGIAHIVAHHLGAAFGGAGHHHPAAHTLYAGVVGRPVGVGAAAAGAVAVAGDAGVHQAGVDGAELVVAEAQPGQGAGAPVVQQDIGNAQHIFEGALSRRVAQVQGNALFVAVDAQVAGADAGAVGAVDVGVVGAGAVAAAGAFNFDDLGAHIGQNEGAEGAGHDVGGVQDAQAGQGERLQGRGSGGIGRVGGGGH